MGPRISRFESFFNRVWLGRGPVAIALQPLSWIYGALIALRRTAFRRGWLSHSRSDVPVIVVGNRVVGGAGKTPAVLALVAHLRCAGWQPGIVSRGHGRAARDTRLVVDASTPRDVGDEPLLLHWRSGAPVAVGRDRHAAARALRAAHPTVDCIVADDGLQHLRWARDIEIVLFDARGAGNGWLLPAGPLREPIDAPGAGRHLLRLYSAGERSTPLPGFVARRSLVGVVSLEEWRSDPQTAARGFAEVRGVEHLHACAGIAQPQRFFDMLRAVGLSFEPHPMTDHADFTALPWPAAAQAVIVTEKDAVKLDPARLAAQRPNTKVWVAPLDFQPEAGFWAALDQALGPSPPGPAR